jgi:hypothetical protein
MAKPRCMIYWKLQTSSGRVYYFKARNEAEDVLDWINARTNDPGTISRVELSEPPAERFHTVWVVCETPHCVG